jgi:CDP-2,3-bis-(O-geranylgeranyl)-sn-glycerol synthase
MSAGALLGDLLKSFFKRLAHRPPGTAWVPFDQIDYILGAVVATRLVVPLSWRQMGIAVAAFVLLHFIVSAAGYLLRLKERPL